MSPPSWADPILMQWAIQLPSLLAEMAGVIAAAVFWRRCRTTSVLTLCAMLLLGALTLLSPAITMAMVRQRIESGWTMQQFGVVNFAVNLILSTGRAVGLGLLLTAAFIRRPAPVVNPPTFFPPAAPFL